MKKNRRLINKVKNEIVGAVGEIAGYTWGINAYRQGWTDDEMRNFNDHTVNVRDNLLEKVDKWLSKALTTASEDVNKLTN